MKVLFSQLKKYLPQLSHSHGEVGEVFSMIGYMLDGPAEEVTYLGQKDYLLDLEVRQNRADCFGVIGLARELSAYYNIPLELPQFELNSVEGSDLSIEVRAEDSVKKIIAREIRNVKVGESPKWLKEYLNVNGINTINNLVDITNFVMLETAHSSHAFDKDKVGNKLIWEMNSQFKKFLTLNGDELDIDSNTLIITNDQKPLSLSFIGSKEDALDESTVNVILEMAIYDGGLVRRNQRHYKILTEAGMRLEKFLDPATLDYAFDMLSALIIEICGGTLYNVYNKTLTSYPKQEIFIDLNKVSQVAGVTIEVSKAKEYLQRLGFEIISEENLVLKVLRPDDRLDIEIAEDVYEEIIRMYGFYNLPISSPNTIITKEVTPKNIKMAEVALNMLASKGYDEVRSNVLVDKKINATSNIYDNVQIEVENSINEDLPYLRQTIIGSLLMQDSNYRKRFLPKIKIFEFGKVFGFKDDYIEFESLGMLSYEGIEQLKLDIESIIRTLGIVDIFYKQAKIVPGIVHPFDVYDIYTGEQQIGIIGKTNAINAETEAYVCEVNFTKLCELTELRSTSAVELSDKIVTLDTNIILDKNQDLRKEVDLMLKNNLEFIWEWKEVDCFKVGEKTKHTIRVSYLNLGDTKAKSLHQKIFAA